MIISGYLLILFLPGLPITGTFLFRNQCCTCRICFIQRINCMGCGMHCGNIGWGCGMGMLGLGGYGMGMMGYGRYGAPFGLGGYNDFYELEVQNNLLGGTPAIDIYGELGYGGFGFGMNPFMGYGGMAYGRPFGYMGYNSRRKKEENPETLVPFS